MTSEDTWSTHPVLPSPPHGSGFCRRERMLTGLQAVARRGGFAADREAAAILAEAVADPGLLQGLILESSADCYLRHFIAGDTGYCVMAIVWQPGQMSRVHSHRAWCALGVQRGTLTETHFACAAAGLQQGDCRHLPPGATSHGAAGDPRAHRVANLGFEPAVSIHAYGLGFDRLASELNQVWAD